MVTRVSLVVIVLGLAMLCVAPVFADTNAWGALSGAGDGSESSIAAAAANAKADLDGTFPMYAPFSVVSGPTVSGSAPNYFLNMTLDGSCGFGACQGFSSGWSFTESCAVLGEEWNSDYGGCVEICTAPDTLNTVTGMCDSPPDCSVFDGDEVDRFFSDTEVGGAICAAPPGEEVLGCEALVAEPAGFAACAGGECFARVRFTGGQCGAEPDVTGELLADEPGDVNCVGGAGVTICAGQSAQNCGTVNGESVCLDTIPPGRCTFLGDGGMVCVSTSDSPPAPTDSGGMDPATPDGSFVGRGADASEDTYNYFGPGTVADSGTPVSGTSSGSTTEEGEEEGGLCEEAGSCPGVVPELGETSTVGEATAAFMAGAEGAPIVVAAASIGASMPAGVCPAPAVDIPYLGGVTLVLDAHCDLWAEIAGVFTFVMLAIYVFVGARIVLSA